MDLGLGKVEGSHCLSSIFNIIVMERGVMPFPVSVELRILVYHFGGGWGFIMEKEALANPT
jgi:hypothetical protein